MEQPPKRSAFRKNDGDQGAAAPPRPPQPPPDRLKALDMSGLEPGSSGEKKFEVEPPPDPRFVEDDPEVSQSDYYLGIGMGGMGGGYIAHLIFLKAKLSPDIYYYLLAGGALAGAVAGVGIGWLLAKFFSDVVRKCSAAIDAAAKVGGAIGFVLGAVGGILMSGGDRHAGPLIVLMAFGGAVAFGLAAIAVAMAFGSVFTLLIPPSKSDDGRDDR